MSIIGWIILGLIAGFIGSKIVNKTGEGFFLDIVLGIVGVLVLKLFEPRPKLLSARASIGCCASDNVFGMRAGQG